MVGHMRALVLAVVVACVANPPPQNTPGPPGTWTCRQIIEHCDSTCGTGICLNACTNQGNPTGAQLHAALIQCAAANRCFDNNCTRALCGPQVDACAADNGGMPVLASNAPPGGPPPGGNGNAPNGNAPNGNAPNGNAPNGNAPNGNAPNGNAPNGNAPNGNAPNGNAPNGNAPNGQLANARPNPPPDSHPPPDPHAHPQPDHSQPDPHAHPAPDPHPQPAGPPVATGDVTGDWSFGAKTVLGTPDGKTGAPRPGSGSGGILRLTNDGRFERATSVEASDGKCKTLTFGYAVGAWKLDGDTLVLSEKQAFASFRDSCHKTKNFDREDTTKTDRRKVRVNDKHEIEVTDDAGELQSYRRK
jgi:hypothetical protein